MNTINSDKIKKFQKNLLKIKQQLKKKMLKEMKF